MPAEAPQFNEKLISNLADEANRSTEMIKSTNHYRHLSNFIELFKYLFYDASLNVEHFLMVLFIFVELLQPHFKLRLLRSTR